MAEAKKAEEMTMEEVSALERLIQVGDPGGKLPDGRTVGEYREQMRARASDPEAARAAGRAETESFRRQAQTTPTKAAVGFARDGRLVVSPVDEAPPELAPAQRAIADDFPHALLLRAGGYLTVEQVAAAPDEDLLKVEGIGPAKVKEIRDGVKALS